MDTLLQAAVDKLLSTGVVSRVDLDETEGKKRRLQNFQTWHKFDIFNTFIRVSEFEKMMRTGQEQEGPRC